MKFRCLPWVVVVCGMLGSTAAQAQDALEWTTDLPAARRTAAASRRLVLMHFWGTWCPPCMKMETEVFTKPGLGGAIHPYFVPVKVQVEEGMNDELVKQYGVDGFPCDIVTTADGQVVARSKGFKAPADYLAMLNQAAQTALSGAAPAPSTAAPAAAPAVGATTNAGGLGAATAATGRVLPTSGAVATPPAATTAAAPQPRAPSDDRYSYYNQDRNGAAMPPRVNYGAAAPTVQPQPGPMPAVVAPALPAITTPNPPAPTPVAPFGTLPSYVTPVAPPAAAAVGPVAATPAAPVGAPLVVTPTAPMAQPAPASNPAPAGAATATAESAPATPGTMRIPQGSPPLALDGYCPVTVTEKMVWKRGDARFGVIHRGRTYLFADATEQTKFLADPDRFAPIISGNDPVAALEQGVAVPGRRELGMMCENRMILFSTKANYDKFSADSKRYTAQIQQALLSGDGSGPIRR